MKKLIPIIWMGLLVTGFWACDSTEKANESEQTTQTGMEEEPEDITTTPVDESGAIATADTATTADTAASEPKGPAATAFTSDSAFIAMATNRSIYETQAGELGVRKAASAEVKKFAQTLVDHHTDATTKLRDLARDNNWYQQQRMLVSDKTTYNRLSGLSGSEFDTEFMSEMIRAHETDISLYESTGQKSTNAAIRAFAGKTLPILRSHLETARKTASQIKNR